MPASIRWLENRTPGQGGDDLHQADDNRPYAKRQHQDQRSRSGPGEAVTRTAMTVPFSGFAAGRPGGARIRRRQLLTRQ